MKYGFRGHRATLKDWETHLNTLFPEVRLKRTIEVRGADSLPANLVCALPALWTGILYDPRALDEAEELMRIVHGRRARGGAPGHRRAGAPRAPSAARRWPIWPARLVDIAAGGLARRARLDKNGKDERIHLAKLAALVEKGWCPADALVEGLGNGDADLRREILARARI